MGLRFMLALLWCIPLVAIAQDPKRTEQSLSSEFGGKYVRFVDAGGPTSVILERPAEFQTKKPAINTAPVLIEAIKVKRQEVEFQARPLIFHRDANGRVQGYKGDGLKFRLKWSRRPSDGENILETVRLFVRRLPEDPRDWVAYWPPRWGELTKRRVMLTRVLDSNAGEIDSPEVVHCPPLNLTLEERRAGEVKVWAKVGTEGRITEVEPFDSGSPEVERAVREFLRECKFRPATQRGELIAARVELKVKTGSAQAMPSEEISPGIHTIGSNTTTPRCRRCADPAYPREAQEDRAEGVVIFNAVVLEDGRIGGIETVRALGHGLEESAVKALMSWWLHPVERDGKPVAAMMMIEVNFHL